jgi:hypothetical protein
MKNQNTNTKTSTNTNKPFIVREFQEVPGGYYECDFYYTPNGSKIFWKIIIKKYFQAFGMMKAITSIVKV